MPPKKATSASATTLTGTPTANPDGEGNTKFTWEGPNDFKLLLLTQGRYVKPEEYERLAGVFGDEISTGSIRNRVSKLRVQQRTLYELHGWAWPEVGSAAGSGGGGSGGSSAKKASGLRGRAKTGTKRGASGSGETGGEPARKKGRRAGKSGGEGLVVIKDEEGEPGDVASLAAVQEDFDESEEEDGI